MLTNLDYTIPINDSVYIVIGLFEILYNLIQNEPKILNEAFNVNILAFDIV